MARNVFPWDVSIPQATSGLPPTPAVPPDEGMQRAVLPIALNDRPAGGATESVVVPREIQTVLNDQATQRTPYGERFDVDAAEEQAARATALAVEQTWTAAIATIRALYAHEAAQKGQIP